MRALFADPRHAGDVVDRVAHQRQHVGHLLRRHAEVLGRPPRVVELVRARCGSSATSVADELHHVLVGGDQDDVEARRRGLARQRADDVVGLVVLELEARDAERLDRALDVRDLPLPRPIPIFLKIAPDLTDDDLAQIAEVATLSGIAGIIPTNTTLSRDGLRSPHRGETGGLSGAPLFEKSTRILAKLSQLTDGKLPLIGVGGISTADHAFQKIRAGASAVQLYTAMVYHGLSVAEKVAKGLDDLLTQAGFASVADAVGTDRARWL